MRIRSIRRFLLWTLLPAMVAVAGGVAAWTYLMAAHEVEELFDAELAQTARVLAGLVDQDMLDDGAGTLAEALAGALSAGLRPHPYESKLSFQLLDSGGRLLFAAPGSPAQGLGPPVPGFSWVPHGDNRWRVYTLADTRGGLWIQAAQRADIREELAREIAVDLLLHSLLTVPLLALTIPLIVAAAFKPVRRIAAELDRRDPSSLKPVDAEKAPAEIRGMVHALNSLFHRLSVAFAAERRFTADAAHELRTPVAGLLVNADNALRAGDEQARRASVQRVAEGARRMQRLVEQLLTLSRLDPDAGLGEWQSVDFASVVTDELSQFDTAARERGVALELQKQGRSTCTGNPTMLGVLVRNLLDNALRHTPAGGKVSVSVRGDGNEIELVVADTGPGIPPALRDRVTERFYRLAGEASEGTGLGLSIVARIAEIHGAELHIGDAGGPEGTGVGLRVRLRLPLRPRGRSGNEPRARLWK
jgi:two-component system, OmpR family, sensor histidine kinase QseC